MRILTLEILMLVLAASLALRGEPPQRPLFWTMFALAAILILYWRIKSVLWGRHRSKERI